jgi:hypothetical protein
LLALAVHGGCYGDLGFNTYTVFPATRALGMPVPLAIAATGMIVDGVLDTFPTLRVGFLEGGTSWMPLPSFWLDSNAIKSNRVNDKNVKGFLTSAPSTCGRYFVSAVLLR